MPRDLPIGNGNIFINYDFGYNIRDIFYPMVGQENHTIGHLSHFGIWTPEAFRWIDSPDIHKELRYAPDSLSTRVDCRSEVLGLSFLIEDAVDAEKDLFVRKMELHNNREQDRTVKLYFHLDLEIYGTPIGDTAVYSPDLRSLLFYKGRRWFSVSAMAEGQKEAGISGFATGKKGVAKLEGTWRDAEDGHLEGAPITQGSVDGTVELEFTIPAGGAKSAWIWMCFGKSRNDISAMEDIVRKESPESFLTRTRAHWDNWLKMDRHELSLLPAETADMYKRCLLITRAHMDNRGAITAANDSDIMKFAKDTYSYMWPRDGALISHALDRSGYFDLTRRFYDFCKEALTPEGYLMHKYNPDGSEGSSWHPWINPQGEKQYPIQEDETALVLFALWHHTHISGNKDQLEDDYTRFVLPAADFLLKYRSASGLPLPSYDLWEERYAVLAFTVASVYAGLLAAASFAELIGDKAHTELYRDGAKSVKAAFEKDMFDPKMGRFLRALYWDPGKKTYVPDLAVDASMYALFDFEMFDVSDPRIVKTMVDVFGPLTVHSAVGGTARYVNDYYQQVSQDIGNVPGNPWFICHLWRAEWLIAQAQTTKQLEEALKVIDWARQHALPSGVMAEQINPYTGEPLSVSPLTWSHATYIKVVQEYLSKHKALTTNKKMTPIDEKDSRVLQVH